MCPVPHPYNFNPAIVSHAESEKTSNYQTITSHQIISIYQIITSREICH